MQMRRARGREVLSLPRLSVYPCVALCDCPGSPPWKVELTERRGASVLQSIARVCALVGGVFNVAGMVDKLIYHSSTFLQKKRIGKLS